MKDKMPQAKKQKIIYGSIILIMFIISIILILMMFNHESINTIIELY